MQRLRNGAAKLLILGLFLVLGACRNAPIESVEQAALRTSPTATLENVADIVRLAASKHGWEVVQEESGMAVLRLNRGRDKWVTTRVTYDTKTVTIRYLDSQNLNYSVRDGKSWIHPGFNRWIDSLKRSMVRFSGSS